MGRKARDFTDRAIQASEDQLEDFQIMRQDAQAQVDRQRQAYENIQLTDPYANLENRFTNVYEDLTVNQQQAQFEAEQGMQQRANIMQGLRGAAGASGIAGLAQSLARQGQLQTQQISASIGQQEAMNQRLMAQGAQRVQEGQAAVDLQRAQGQAMLQEAETSRAATLLGMDYGALAGAAAGEQQAYQNQQAAYQMEINRITGNRQMAVDFYTGLLGAGKSAASGGAF